MAADIDGVRIIPGGVNARKWWEEGIANQGPIRIGEILCAGGVSGNKIEVRKADSRSVAGGGFGPAPLYMAQTKGILGGRICFSSKAVITADTTGRTFHDPVFLSETAGAISFTQTGHRRYIGVVLEVGVQGKILFDGSMPARTSIIHGTVEFTNDVEIEVTLFSLAANINGATVVATANTLDGTIHVVAAEISGSPSLTITMSAAFTGTVSYAIFLP